MNIFDTLDHTNAAIHAGYSREQAEFQASTFGKIFNDDMVTKSFMSKEMVSVRHIIKNEVKSLEDRLTIRLGVMMFACAGLTITMLGFIGK